MVLIGVLVAMFGPRIGPIDYIALAALYLAALAAFSAPLKLTRDMKILLGILVAYFAYVIAIYGITGQTDLYLLGRVLRMLASTFLLGVAFSTFRLSPVRVFGMVMVGLVLHALMVLAQITFPDLKAAVGSLYGYDKYYLQYRALGLTSGYDGASLLLVIGLVFTAMKVFSGRSNPLWAGVVPVFVLATFFTGRTGMIISVAVLALLSMRFAARGRGVVRLLSFVFLASTVWFGLAVVRVILVQTMPESRAWLGQPMLATDSFIFQDQYAPQTGVVLVRMMRLPATWADTLLGTGAAPEDIDIGYIRMIHMTGLVGFLWVLAAYGFLWSRAASFRRYYLALDTDEGRRLSVVASGLVVAILLMVFYNFKSLFFFARSSHELFMIVFAALASDVYRRGTMTRQREFIREHLPVGRTGQ